MSDSKEITFNWINEEYEQFRKLPPTTINMQPYHALGTAILKRVVVDLFVAYKKKDKRRIESIHNSVRRNGICELMGIDIDYLDRLAKNRDCTQYKYNGRDKR